MAWEVEKCQVISYDDVRYAAPTKRPEIVEKEPESTKFRIKWEENNEEGS